MLSSIIVESRAHMYMIPGCEYSALRFARDFYLNFVSDPANGAGLANDTSTLAYMQQTFNDHYSGNRQPIGLYTHPLRLAVCNPFL
jgi:hypothetical protein